MEPLAALTALSDLRMRVYSNGEQPLTLHLSQLTALTNLQVGGEHAHTLQEYMAAVCCVVTCMTSEGPPVPCLAVCYVGVCHCQAQPLVTDNGLIIKPGMLTLLPRCTCFCTPAAPLECVFVPWVLSRQPNPCPSVSFPSAKHSISQATSAKAGTLPSPKPPAPAQLHAPPPSRRSST